jgi:hypothetical protein
MKSWAASVIAARPTEGAPSLILSDPFAPKNEATLAAFWLHQAPVYRAAKSFSLFDSMKLLSSSPPECFKLAIGVHMQGARGEGVVVGALCSPANQFTQYWIKRSNGQRFWATLNDLNPR